VGVVSADAPEVTEDPSTTGAASITLTICISTLHCGQSRGSTSKIFRSRRAQLRLRVVDAEPCSTASEPRSRRAPLDRILPPTWTVEA
jgi:hypothetical protein